MSVKRRGGRLGRWLRFAAVLAASIVALAVIVDRAAFRGSGYPPPHIKNKTLFAPAAPRPGTWALLISGGVRPRKNYPRYWNNTSLLFCTFKALGWENIRTLYAGGPTAARDRLERAFLGMFSFGGLVSSPADLDGDGTPDLSGPATADGIAREIADIGGRMRPGDTLFVFITDHGRLVRVNGRLEPIAGLWGDTITGEWLDKLLKAHVPDASWTAILAAQCWGRAFLKGVTRPKTLLIAPGRPNWIWSSQDYSIFPLKFCEALLEKEIPSARPVRADGDGDGCVSLREAFRSARARDHTPEWPVLWVNGEAAALPALF